jgi:ascorbate-specific PTS system EIIC-type component UlaA
MTGIAESDYIDGFFPLDPIRTSYIPGWFVAVDRSRNAVVAGFRSSISGKGIAITIIAAASCWCCC